MESTNAKFHENDVISGSDLQQNLAFDDGHIESNPILRSTLLIVNEIHSNHVIVKQVLNKEPRQAKNALIDQITYNREQQFEVVEQPNDQLPQQENIHEPLRYQLE